MKLKTESILFPVCPKVDTKVNVNPRVTNARAPVKSLCHSGQLQFHMRRDAFAFSLVQQAQSLANVII